MKESLRRKVRELALERKPVRGNRDSEAYAVQFLGESESAMAYLREHPMVKARDGKTLAEWAGERAEFLEQNPNLDMGRVQKAVEVFREIYDGLFEQMNAARIRNGYEPVDYRKGYFPHFSDKGGDGLLNTFAEALGVRMEVKELAHHHQRTDPHLPAGHPLERERHAAHREPDKIRRRGGL